MVHGLVKTAEDYLQSPKGSTKSNKSGESPRTSVKGKGNSNDFFDILMLTSTGLIIIKIMLENFARSKIENPTATI